MITLLLALAAITANQGGAVQLRFPNEPGVVAVDARWGPGWRYWLVWACVPLLVLLLAGVSVLSHDEPLWGSHLRFGPPDVQKTR